MKRPSRIDGHDRICCGSKQAQCEDCPMKAWAAESACVKVEWSVEQKGWVRDGVKFDSWEDAMYGKVGAARRRYESAKSNRKAHPDTIQRLWEELCDAERSIIGKLVV